MAQHVLPELLVHVSAAATARDDRRYLSIAQNIIDFEAAAVTTVTELSSPNTIDGSQTFAASNPGEQSSAFQGSHGDHTHINELSSFESDHNSSHQLSSFDSPDLSTLRKEAISSPAQERLPWLNTFINPPYKNPFRAKRKADSLETPKQYPRPHSAVELHSDPIQVPNTGSASRRAYSETILFNSFSSHVSNSQPSSSMSETNAPPSSSAPPALGNAKAKPVRATTGASSQTPQRKEPPRKRLRREQDTVASEAKIISPPAPEQPFFLRDRSMDWTSSPTRNSSSQQSSDSATASPSQPIVAADCNTETASPKTKNNADSPIIVQSSESISQPRTPAQAHSADNDPDSNLEELSKVPQSRIDKLPKEVQAPAPPTGDGKFTSHITENMHDIVYWLSLDRYFRPVKVSRDVKVLERGHWSLEITIGAEETLKEARKSPSHEVKMRAWSERFAAPTARERLAKLDEAKRKGPLADFDYPGGEEAIGLWTEDEFVRIWEEFYDFIKGGRGGWGSFMTRDRMDDGKSGAERYRIRIFGWGELLAHTYIAMYVLSKQLTARIPMKWIAANGDIIIEMSGTRAGRGKLPAWSRKGLDGEQGSWGVAED